MARNKNVIGSVAGIENEAKKPDAPKDIHSEPDNTEVGERDSGIEADPTVTEPVEEAGNLDPVQDQSNITPASDNPTNAEVARASDDNGVDELDSDFGDLQPDLLDGLNEEKVDDDEAVVLSDEELATAAAELEAEQAEREAANGESADNEPTDDDATSDDALVNNGPDQQEARPDGDDTPRDAINPQDDPEPVTEPVEEKPELLPAHNSEGYRNRFVNQRGGMSTMDDETAKMFHDDPKFYSYVYDESTHRNVNVEFLNWCDEKGNITGGRVGDNYELGK